MVPSRVRTRKSSSQCTSCVRKTAFSTSEIRHIVNKLDFALNLHNVSICCYFDTNTKRNSVEIEKLASNSSLTARLDFTGLIRLRCNIRELFAENNGCAARICLDCVWKLWVVWPNTHASLHTCHLVNCTTTKATQRDVLKPPWVTQAAS